jgi:hypothetical protein
MDGRAKDFLVDGQRRLVSPEGETMEYKLDIRAKSRILQTLIAFANTAGGTLVLGVNEDRTVIGVSDPEVTKTNIINMLESDVLPRFLPLISVVTIEGRPLVVVRVFPSESRPHYAAKSGPTKGVYIRVGPSTVQANQIQIDELSGTIHAPVLDEPTTSFAAPYLAFFDRMPAAIPLFEAVEEFISSTFDDVQIRVQKSQISFSNVHNFAFIWLPIGRIKNRPEVCIALTFGLDHQVVHPRILESVEPYPNRWTHHMLIATKEEVDDQVKAWISQAYHFSAMKARKG